MKYLCGFMMLLMVSFVPCNSYRDSTTPGRGRDRARRDFPRHQG